ncbi:hypothetical protein LXL04_020016 [Taraxacum kok-saghyz]
MDCAGGCWCVGGVQQVEQGGRRSRVVYVKKKKSDGEGNGNKPVQQKERNLASKKEEIIARNLCNKTRSKKKIKRKYRNSEKETNLANKYRKRENKIEYKEEKAVEDKKEKKDKNKDFKRNGEEKVLWGKSSEEETQVPLQLTLYFKLDSPFNSNINFDFRASSSLSRKYKIPIGHPPDLGFHDHGHVLDHASRSHNQISQRLYTESILQTKTCCKNMKHPEVELYNKENPDLGTEVASSSLNGFNLNYYHGLWLT